MSDITEKFQEYADNGFEGPDMEELAEELDEEFPQKDRTRKQRRVNDYTKAIRKKKLAKQMFGEAKVKPDETNAKAEEKAASVHKFSKAKVHCSCPLCSAKTNRNGPKPSEERRLQAMWQEEKAFSTSDIDFEVFPYDENMEDIQENDPLDGMELGNLLFGHSRGAYRIDRELQDLFGWFFEELGLDAYGHPDKDSIMCSYETEKPYGMETEMFEIRPYYWGDVEEWQELPNFLYKPEGLEIRWYKYPLRDSYSNQPLDREKLKDILEKCVKFVKK